MAFVHPMLVIGLALGLVPILIHLLTRRRFRIVRWGAMKYLLAAIEENSRRVQIEDMILLALRVLGICLLALALSRPFVAGRQPPPTQPRLAVILVDNSPSMTAKRGAISRWELARRWSKDLMRQLPSGSAVAIAPLAGPAGPSAGVLDPTLDIALAGRVLDGMAISGRAADPVAALQAANAIIDKSPLLNRSVYIISDFQANDWKAPAGAELKNLLAQSGTSVVAVQCSGGEIENGSVTDLERTLRIIKVDSPFQLNGTLARHSPPQTPRTDAANLTATLWVDGNKSDSRTQPVLAGDRRQFTYFTTLDKDGCHALELRLTPDICPADDVRYLALEARDEVRVLCVDGDPHPGEEWLSSTYYLRLALSPEIGALSPISAKVIAPADFAREELKNYDLVVLANVAQIDPTRSRDLAAYVRSGKALVVFLGDQVEADSYNATLFGSGPDGLLAAHLGAAMEAPAAPTPDAEAGFHIRADSLAGPVLGYFANPAHDGGLARAGFTKALSVDLETAKNAFVHARLGNGAPLMFSADVGEGRLAVLNTSADVSWTNLPARPAFLPLIQRLVVWMLEPASRCANLRPGQKYRLSLPLSDNKTTLTIKTPDNRSASLQPRTNGDRAVFEFTDTVLPGFYDASWTSADNGQLQRRLFAVNIDAAEGDLTTLEAAGFRDLAGSPTVGWIDPAAAGAGIAASAPSEVHAGIGGGSEWWREALLAALLIFAAETYLSRRFSGSAQSVHTGGPRA